jgi:hypothetical protein
MTISTRNLGDLSDVEGLRRLIQSMALLDAILSPDWEYRYHSFNAHWAEGEQMGSMRNGLGDDFFALFDHAGCFLKGFVHDSLMAPCRSDPKKIWPGVIDHVPPAFARGLGEPAFSVEDTTFCLWRGPCDPSWQVGPIEWPEDPDPDGSAQLLTLLDGNPESYQQYAEDYFEREIDMAAIEHVYAHKPLTQELLFLVNPGLSLEDLEADIVEIGYPRD